MRPAVIAGAALLAGLAACALVLSSDHMADRVVWAVFGPVVGWNFVGTGLYASRRRPESRFGALMVLLGFTWLLAPLGAADDPWLFVLGIVLGSLWGPVLAHVLLSFPSGRLTGAGQRAVVVAAYVARAARARARNAGQRVRGAGGLRRAVPRESPARSRTTSVSARSCSPPARPW